MFLFSLSSLALFRTASDSKILEIYLKFMQIANIQSNEGNLCSLSVVAESMSPSTDTLVRSRNQFKGKRY